MQKVITIEAFNEYIDDQIKVALENLKSNIRNSSLDEQCIIKSGTRLNVLEEVRDYFKEDE